MGMMRALALGMSLSLVSLAATAQEPNLTKLQQALGGMPAESVQPTPVKGLFEVIVQGRVLYVTEDGQFAFSGDLIDLEKRNNLTEARMDGLRKQAVDAISPEQMVVFKPKETRHVVTVFTDIDCGYCRKLHSDMQAYLDRGIEIRYLMFPRAGLGSESHLKAVSVWCASDRQVAMTKAKRGETVERKVCENPVEQQFKLGVKLGVQGTPALVLDNGQLVPGYVPAAELAQMLDLGRAQANAQPATAPQADPAPVAAPAKVN